MQYDVKTPEQYFAALPNDWRKDKLLKVNEMLLSAAPELELAIQYKMLAYGAQFKSTIFNLNAQKNFVGLYVGNIQKVSGNESLLKSFDCGKGCIRLKKTSDLDDPGLNQFIAKAVQLWRSGEDLGC